MYACALVCNAPVVQWAGVRACAREQSIWYRRMAEEVAYAHIIGVRDDSTGVHKPWDDVVAVAGVVHACVSGHTNATQSRVLPCTERLELPTVPVLCVLLLLACSRGPRS